MSSSGELTTEKIGRPLSLMSATDLAHDGDDDDDGHGNDMMMMMMMMMKMIMVMVMI